MLFLDVMRFATTDVLPQFPHLIIPIDSANPNEAYGSSYNGTISETVSSIYNFDIPVSDNGKTCSLVFYFPGTSTIIPHEYHRADFSSQNKHSSKLPPTISAVQVLSASRFSRQQQIPAPPTPMRQQWPTELWRSTSCPAQRPPCSRSLALATHKLVCGSTPRAAPACRTSKTTTLAVSQAHLLYLGDSADID